MEEGRPCFASSRSARIYVSRAIDGDDISVLDQNPAQLAFLTARLSDAGIVVPNPLGGLGKERLSGIASSAAGCTSYFDFDRRDSFLRGEADVLCCLLR